MNDKKDLELVKDDEADTITQVPQPSDDEAPGDEFRLIIKKLEMPVRPRGVLAE
jgi:hypothetical protein